MNDALGSLLPFFTAFATLGLGLATLNTFLARRAPVRVRASNRSPAVDTH